MPSEPQESKPSKWAAVELVGVTIAAPDGTLSSFLMDEIRIAFRGCFVSRDAIQVFVPVCQCGENCED